MTGTAPNSPSSGFRAVILAAVTSLPESLRARSRMVARIGFVDGYEPDERRYHWVTTWYVHARDRAHSERLLRLALGAHAMGRLLTAEPLGVAESGLEPPHSRALAGMATDGVVLALEPVVGFKKGNTRALLAALGYARNLCCLGVSPPRE